MAEGGWNKECLMPHIGRGHGFFGANAKVGCDNVMQQLCDFIGELGN